MGIKSSKNFWTGPFEQTPHVKMGPHDEFLGPRGLFKDHGQKLLEIRYSWPTDPELLWAHTPNKNNIMDQIIVVQKSFFLRLRNTPVKSTWPVLPVSEARLQWTISAKPFLLWVARIFVMDVKKKSYFAAGITPTVVMLHQSTTQWSSVAFTSLATNEGCSLQKTIHSNYFVENFDRALWAGPSGIKTQNQGVCWMEHVKYFSDNSLTVDLVESKQLQYIQLPHPKIIWA